MASTLLQLRLVHGAFLFTWFMYVALVVYLRWPEKPLEMQIPLAMGFITLVLISTALKIRRLLVHMPAAALASQPQDAALLKKWRGGNVFSFAAGESIMLFGVVLKFLGAEWKIAGIFFAVGLLFLLLWTPRRIATTTSS